MKRTNAAQNGYLPSNWETGDPVENREKADFANKYWGVTPAQEQAMLCGSMFGCDKIGHCDTGSAVITPGFHLKAKYIIHAVGPVWAGGDNDEEKLLYGAYYRSLELAKENGCASIGFPLISTGVFGYPIDQAWRVAIWACADFIERGNQIDVVFAVLNERILEAGQITLKDTAPQLAR